MYNAGKIIISVRKMKKNLFAILYTVLLLGFTLFVVLDTFAFKSAPEITIQKNNKIAVAPGITEAATVISEENNKNERETEKTEIEKTASPDITEVPTVIDSSVEPAVTEIPPETEVEGLNPGSSPTDSPLGSDETVPGSEQPSTGPEPTMVPTWTENGYTDSQISVTITKYREYDSDIFVADIVLKSPDLLKTQLSKAVKGSTWEVVSDISKACDNLIISVNGDCWASRTGYSIKNGVLLRNKITKYTDGITREEPDQEDYVIFTDGSTKVIREGDYSAEELLDMGVWQLFNFGPVLIDDYKDVSRASVSTSNVATELAPRTAIGVVDDLHYVFIVVDGRSWTKALNYMNRGVTCYQLAEFGMTLGLKSLYNLDGGGSATLFFNGKVLNNPCRHGKKIEEQTVSDIIYVGY